MNISVYHVRVRQRFFIFWERCTKEVSILYSNESKCIKPYGYYQNMQCIEPEMRPYKLYVIFIFCSYVSCEASTWARNGVLILRITPGSNFKYELIWPHRKWEKTDKYIARSFHSMKKPLIFILSINSINFYPVGQAFTHCLFRNEPCYIQRPMNFEIVYGCQQMRICHRTEIKCNWNTEWNSMF